MKLPPFMVALLFAWIFAPANAETLKVSTLDNNEEIRIEFSSRGCFHNTKFFYVLRGGKSKFMDISEAKSEWNTEKKEMLDLGVVLLGTVPLKAEDINGLDHLFSFYRMEKNGGCTTMDHLKVEYVRAGQVIGNEQFIDSSCATSSLRMMKENEEYRKQVGEPTNWALLKQITTFDEIVGRIKREGPTRL